MKSISLFIGELILRWKAEVPSFWVKIRNFALWASGISTAVFQANASMNLELSSIIVDACKYIIVAGLVAAGCAQTTKK